MKKLTCATLLAALALALGGCQGPAEDVSYGSIVTDLSPELLSLSERPVDYHRHLMYSADSNARLLFNDLARTFYWDHPSQLSPYPIVSGSGNPR